MINRSLRSLLRRSSIKLYIYVNEMMSHSCCSQILIHNIKGDFVWFTLYSIFISILHSATILYTNSNDMPHVHNYKKMFTVLCTSITLQFQKYRMLKWHLIHFLHFQTSTVMFSPIPTVFISNFQQCIHIHKFHQKYTKHNTRIFYLRCPLKHLHSIQHLILWYILLTSGMSS